MTYFKLLTSLFRGHFAHFLFNVYKLSHFSSHLRDRRVKWEKMRKAKKLGLILI